MMDGEQFVLNLLGDKVCKERFAWYEAAALIDHTGKILYVSDHHEIVTGFKSHEIIGTKLCDRLNPIDMPYIHEQHQIMVQTGKPSECKFQILYKDGLYHTVRSLVIPQYNDYGDFVGSVLLGKRRPEILIAPFRKTHILTELPFAI